MRPRTCERAAELVSLELDGELSRFEQVLLARHLRRCRFCADHAARVAGATELLRSAALERLSAPITLPSYRRRRLPVVFQTAAATAAVAAFGLWFGFSPSQSVRTDAQLAPLNVNASLASDLSAWPGGVLPKHPPVTPFLVGGQRGIHA